MKKKEIDIGVDDFRDVSLLSNFSEFHFYVDELECFSMEGFLQSLKFSDYDKQKEICLLIGKKAKFKGKKKKWYIEQKLYWKGVAFDRDSFFYQELLDKAFSALYKVEEYRHVLDSTKGFKLTHSLGKVEKNKTILTIDEFCDRLIKLRDY
jgi:hypothetical protein